MSNLAELNKLTKQIIGAAIKVHRHLGPGLLESTYETCLAYELQQIGLSFERQKAIPLVSVDPKCYDNKTSEVSRERLCR